MRDMATPERLPFQRATRRGEQLKLGVILFLAMAIVAHLLWPDLYPRLLVRREPQDVVPLVDVYYANCAAARAAGAAPIYRGQPGYRPALDADNDGIACEPYFGRRY